MEKVDQDYADELIMSSHSDPSSSQEDLKLSNSQITYDEIQATATNLGKGDRILDMEVIMQFLQVTSCCDSVGTRGEQNGVFEFGPNEKFKIFKEFSTFLNRQKRQRKFLRYHRRWRDSCCMSFTLQRIHHLMFVIVNWH